jgi:aspartyl/glutamyl-tRNA(Asn/Gln) amidotransferase C subunit
MISEEEIRNIAKLSYLEIKDEEIDKMRESFSSILEYVKSLQKLDVSTIEETSNLSKISNVFRADIGARKDNGKIIEAFNRKKDNYLAVKKILYNED